MKLYLLRKGVVLSTALMAASLALVKGVIPEDIKEIVSEHLDEIITHMIKERHHSPKGKLPELKVAKFNWLPAHLIKFGKDRVEGAKRIKKCIKEHNLENIVVPKKWIYTIPQEYIKSQKETWVPQELVIVQWVEGTQNDPLTLNQVKDYRCVIENTFLRDNGRTNSICTSTGQIALIDTEARGFSQLYTLKESLNNLLENNDFEPDAREYLENEVALLPDSE